MELFGDDGELARGVQNQAGTLLHDEEVVSSTVRGKAWTFLTYGDLRADARAARTLQLRILASRWAAVRDERTV
jgi:hypothetical protein